MTTIQYYLIFCAFGSTGVVLLGLVIAVARAHEGIEELRKMTR